MVIVFLVRSTNTHFFSIFFFYFLNIFFLTSLRLWGFDITNFQSLWSYYRIYKSDSEFLSNIFSQDFFLSKKLFCQNLTHLHNGAKCLITRTQFPSLSSIHTVELLIFHQQNFIFQISNRKVFKV